MLTKRTEQATAAYYEQYYGKVIHAPGPNALPPFFDRNALPASKGDMLVYITSARYQFGNLTLFAIDVHGNTLALEILGFRPHVFVRQAQVQEGDDLLLTITDILTERRASYASRYHHNPSRRYNEDDDHDAAAIMEITDGIEIVAEKRFVVPPAPVHGKSDVWKITFPDWRTLTQVIPQLIEQRQVTVLQYEDLRCELLYLLERKLRLHSWATLDLSKTECVRLEHLRKTNGPVWEFQCQADGLSPPAAPCDLIPLQLVVTCDTESVAQAGLDVLRTHYDWIVGLWIKLGHLLGSLDDHCTDLILAYFSVQCKQKPSVYTAPNVHSPSDPMVSISTHFQYLSHSKTFLTVGHMLKSVEPLQNKLPERTVLFSFDTEADMLRHWVRMVRDLFDVDLIGGHNWIFYDAPTMYDRSVTVGVDLAQGLSRFYRIRSGFISSELKPVEYDIETKGRGKMHRRRLVWPGVRQFDTCEIAKQLYGTLEDHKLETCATELIDVKSPFRPLLRKKGLPYEALAAFWSAGPALRGALWDYNDHDVFLVDVLLREKGFLDFVIETSADTYTALTDIVARGQSIRCWQRSASDFYNAKILVDRRMQRRLIRMVRSKMPHEMRRKLYDATRFDVADAPIKYEDRPKSGKNDSKKKKKGKEEEDTFKGGRCKELQEGFYRDAILSLDFSGLYPSIAVALLLCLSQYLPHWDLYRHEDILHKAEQIAKAFDPTLIYFPTLPQTAKYLSICITFFLMMLCIGTSAGFGTSWI